MASAYEDVAARSKSPAASSRPTTASIWPVSDLLTLRYEIDGSQPSPRELRAPPASDAPWLTVCSFLNPHDDSLFGAIALTQGLRYHPSQVPHVDQAPTHDEDLSTKPSCQQSYVDNWSSIIAPQPWNEIHLKFYYQMQAEVGRQITRVLDALRDTDAYENTIVIFCSDHGDLQGAHGGMHEKWHVAYEEALHVPFIVSSPCCPAAPASSTSPPTTPT
jgi:arylsulfatase A-like enzyme